MTSILSLPLVGRPARVSAVGGGAPRQRRKKFAVERNDTPAPDSRIDPHRGLIAASRVLNKSACPVPADTDSFRPDRVSALRRKLAAVVRPFVSRDLSMAQ